MKITLVNPSETIVKNLSKWEIGFGYTQTCRSNTCSCFSHDSGFGWKEYDIPGKIWSYVAKKIGHTPGDPSSHKSCYWILPKLERDLRDRGERAAQDAQYVIEAEKEGIKHARYLGDYQVIANIRSLTWATLTKQASAEYHIFQLVQDLRQRAEDKRKKEWARQFARRDGIVFPLKGRGWNFIPA